MRFLQNKKVRIITLGGGLFLALQALVLFIYGQPPICTCGYVKFWEGVVLGPGNSQHITDWYTFSHIIHGFIFYLILWKIFPRIPAAWRLLMAMGIEVSWELVENTPTIIQHYREQALAQGYTGDSIINSLSDTLSMVVGFVMARKLPVLLIVCLAVGLEIFTAIMIRDNLTLNIINLLHPFEFISHWQQGS